jgi:chemotaxis protein CheC
VELNADQEDAIREVFNIGIGRAAATLSELIGTRIELCVPRVALHVLDDTGAVQLPVADGASLAVVQDFRGRVVGRSALILPYASGLRLASLLGDVAEPADELDLELSGILAEVGNIMLNCVLGAISNMIGSHLTYSVPQFTSAPVAGALLGRWTPAHRSLLTADAEFSVRQHSIQGTLLIIMRTSGIKEIVDAICAVGA